MLTDEQRESLIKAASDARGWAYAPYSNYFVGAALLAESGEIYDGVNVENAAYPTSMCAERTAVFKAISQGERKFLAIAVVTENGGSPCGACRQVLAEFGLDIVVLIADGSGKLLDEKKLIEMLPGAFGPEHLPEHN